MMKKMMEKAKALLNTAAAKFMAVAAVATTLLGGAASAADPTPPPVVSASDWGEVLSAITGQISVSTVVGVIAAAAGAAIGFVFLWWGVRKVVRMIMSAFKKGKLSV